jgi:hypothetical protein
MDMESDAGTKSVVAQHVARTEKDAKMECGKGRRETGLEKNSRRR